MIKILSYVYDKLSNDAEVAAIVGTDIFPNVVPDTDGTGQIKFPHIVMTRLNIEPTYTKNPNCVQDLATVEVLCWNPSYFDIIDLAEKVRSALEFSTGDVGVTVNIARFSSIDEGFSDVAHYQRLIFTFK